MLCFVAFEPLKNSAFTLPTAFSVYANVCMN